MRAYIKLIHKHILNRDVFEKMLNKQINIGFEKPFSTDISCSTDTRVVDHKRFTQMKQSVTDVRLIQFDDIGFSIRYDYFDGIAIFKAPLSSDDEKPPMLFIKCGDISYSPAELFTYQSCVAELKSDIFKPGMIFEITAETEKSDKKFLLLINQPLVERITEEGVVHINMDSNPTLKFIDMSCFNECEISLSTLLTYDVNSIKNSRQSMLPIKCGDITYSVGEILL